MPESKAFWKRNNNQAFFICPIGKPNTDIRKRADEITDYLVQPAIKECGFSEVIRADRIAEPGQIPTQVINHLIEDDIVIADVHGSNANVLYELAVRHTTGKPCVQLAEEGDELPFDIYGTRTIIIDKSSGVITGWEKAKQELIKHIQFLQKHPEPTDSLITMAFDILRLRRSQGLLDVFAMMEPTRPTRHLIRDAYKSGKTWRDLEPEEKNKIEDFCRKIDALGCYDRLGIVNSLHVDVFYAPPIVELYDNFLKDFVANERRVENRGPTHLWEMVQFCERIRHVPSNHPAVTGDDDWPPNPRMPRYKEKSV